MIAEEARAAQPARRAVPPGLLLPAGDRRRDLQLLPRRADPARRRHARRARRPEPGAPHLLRGGDRGAADHRDGARRDDRRRASSQALAPPGRRHRRCSGRSLSPASASREGVGARPCRAARAARRRHRASSPRIPSARRSGSTRRSTSLRAVHRRDARPRRHRAGRRAPRGPRGLSHVRQRPRLGAPRCARRSRNGLTAEAAVERVQSDTRARMQRADRPDPARAAARSRRSRQPAPAPPHRRRPHGRRRRRCRENAIIVARTMGPAALLDYDRDAAARPRARGGRADQPCRHRRPRARHRRRRRGRERRRLVENGDAIIVDGGAGEVHIRPPADVEAAYAEKVRFRARRQEQYQALRDQPAVTRDGQRDRRCYLNAGLLVDLPHVEESGRRRHRPLPHRAAVHDRLAIARAPASSCALYTRGAGGGRRPAGDLPHARYRRRQGAALHARRRGGEPGAGLARHPPRPRPAGAAALAAARAAPGRRPGASCASCSR